MANELIISMPEVMGEITISEGALSFYKFIRANAGLEMDEGAVADFISSRNFHSREARELNEARKGFEKLAKDMKESLEHAYNIGGFDDLPPEGEDGVKITWSKQSYMLEWKAVGDGVNVINDLIAKGIVRLEDVICEVSPDALIRASGITKDKLCFMYPEALNEKPKKRTLNIK